MRREDLKVPEDKLKFTCDPAIFEFGDTSQVEPLKDFVGQERAIQALEMGLEIETQGYNIFATGLTSTGRNAVIREHLKKFAKNKKESGKVFLQDFCYVANFESSDRPKILVFEKGKGREFKEKIDGAYYELKKKIPELLKAENCAKLKEEITKKTEEEINQLFEAVKERSKEGHLILAQTPNGQMMPYPRSKINPDEQMTKDEYDTLEPDEKKALEKNSRKILRDLEKAFSQIKELQIKAEKEIANLEKKITGEAIDAVLEIIAAEYRPSGDDNPGYLEVLNYLDGWKKFAVKNSDLFLPQENRQQLFFGAPTHNGNGNGNGNGRVPAPFAVNLFVDNSKNDAPPIIIETNPTFAGLFGKIEKEAVQGAYFTDYTMIRPGSLCLADGGYLVVNVLDLLRNVMLWFKLIKCLKSGYVKIEEPAEALGYLMPATLNPAAVPINVKVIVIGEPMFYQLLLENDPDFPTVFKIRADFDFRMELNQEHLQNYAGFVSFCCQKEKLLPFDPSGIAQIAEYGARLVDDQKKLSTQFGKIKNLIVEANYWAKKAQSRTVKAKHVQKAIEAQRQRLNLSEERYQEFIAEGSFLIDTEGEKVGQINGLAVYSGGDYAFGIPSRITAKTFLGKKGVVSIQREVGMAGPIHNTGVGIISGYFGEKYGQDKTLAFSASLCFEQSYDGVEGDSASAAELFALISSIAKVPISQSFAVTGSVNQNGEIQPIGGVNHKIEGFFDICKKRGLSGEQGVVIPHQNVKNLMLRDDVVEATRAGKFHIFAIKTIDEGIEILMQKNAEEVHKLVNENLKKMIDLLKSEKELNTSKD